MRTTEKKLKFDLRKCGSWLNLVNLLLSYPLDKSDYDDFMNKVLFSGQFENIYLLPETLKNHISFQFINALKNSEQDPLFVFLKSFDPKYFEFFITFINEADKKRALMMMKGYNAKIFRNWELFSSLDLNKISQLKTSLSLVDLDYSKYKIYNNLVFLKAALEIELNEKTFPQLASLKLNGGQTAKEIFDTIYSDITDAEKKALFNNILLKARHFGEAQPEIALSNVNLLLKIFFLSILSTK